MSVGLTPEQIEAILRAGGSIKTTRTTKPAVTESATATGPGLKASGKEVATDFRADAPVVELNGASASGGNTESVGSVLGYDIDPQHIELAMIGGAFGLVIWAVLIAKRGDLKGAVFPAIAAVCVFAAVFYQWVLLVALAVIVFWIARSSWSASALPKVRKTLGVVTGAIEDDTENGPAIKKATAKRAKREGVGAVLDGELKRANVK